MCTALSYHTKDHYFGRNLDLEYSYQETVTVTPRNCPFHFRNGKLLSSHYALIGMATVADGYPLYYEATNEAGLSLAGLNFPGNAVYFPKAENHDNIAPFELIPWLLGQCRSVQECWPLLDRLNLWNENFSATFPLSPLHWMLTDSEESITIESTKEGLKVHANPVGVLTNNPPFDYHMCHLSQFLNLTPEPPVNRFSQKVDLRPYSLGMGAIGLPGDLSSASRFIRIAFGKLNSLSGDSESESISQFFHLLGSVAQTRGLTKVRDKEYEITLYSSCCNTKKGIYYYTTYENSQITAVSLHKEDLDGTTTVSYPLIKNQQINYQN